MLQVAALVTVVVLYALFGWFMAKQYQNDYDELLKKDKHAAQAMLEATTHFII